MKIAFTPAVYEHAARFVNRTPWEVSRDPELLFEGHRRAYLQYRHQVIVRRHRYLQPGSRGVRRSQSSHPRTTPSRRFIDPMFKSSMTRWE